MNYKKVSTFNGSVVRNLSDVSDRKFIRGHSKLGQRASPIVLYLATHFVGIGQELYAFNGSATATSFQLLSSIFVL